MGKKVAATAIPTTAGRFWREQFIADAPPPPRRRARAPPRPGGRDVVDPDVGGREERDVVAVGARPVPDVLQRVADHAAVRVLDVVDVEVVVDDIGPFWTVRAAPFVMCTWAPRPSMVMSLLMMSSLVSVMTMFLAKMIQMGCGWMADGVATAYRRHREGGKRKSNRWVQSIATLACHVGLTGGPT
ncbi:hypothetical protein BRADI_3g53085v3 [Brachypodium distachyon]|uniref:Uncharacterized protein n=1 Tax=Brachypodium distachyon TaxID=15368 RepID=A0A0Q3FS67_BRADI|nr:hypothetical protein BRADI_3g53085v3 [Brachypodium distachyon]